MKYYFTYIVECSDKTYYTGFTDNVERRVYEHNEGIIPSAYTFNRRPVRLVFSYRFNTLKAAKNFERQIKGWRRAKKEALIKGDWELLPELSQTSR